MMNTIHNILFSLACTSFAETPTRRDIAVLERNSNNPEFLEELHQIQIFIASNLTRFINPHDPKSFEAIGIINQRIFRILNQVEALKKSSNTDWIVLDDWEPIPSLGAVEASIYSKLLAENSRVADSLLGTFLIERIYVLKNAMKFQQLSLDSYAVAQSSHGELGVQEMPIVDSSAVRLLAPDRRPSAHQLALEPLLLSPEERAAIYQLANQEDPETGRIFLRELLAEEAYVGRSPFHQWSVRQATMSLYELEKSINNTRVPVFEGPGFRDTLISLDQFLARTYSRNVIELYYNRRRLAHLDHILMAVLTEQQNAFYMHAQLDALRSLEGNLARVIEEQEAFLTKDPNHEEIYDAYILNLRLGISVAQRLLSDRTRIDAQEIIESFERFKAYSTSLWNHEVKATRSTARNIQEDPIKLDSDRVLELLHRPDLGLHELSQLYLDVFLLMDRIAARMDSPNDAIELTLRPALQILGNRLALYGIPVPTDFSDLFRLVRDIRKKNVNQYVFADLRSKADSSNTPILLNLYQLLINHYWGLALIPFAAQTPSDSLHLRLTSRLLHEFGLTLPDDIDDASSLAESVLDIRRDGTGTTARIPRIRIAHETIWPKSATPPLFIQSGDWPIQRIETNTLEDGSEVRVRTLANQEYKVTTTHTETSLRESIQIRALGAEPNDPIVTINPSEFMPPAFIESGAGLDYDLLSGWLQISGRDTGKNPFSFEIRDMGNEWQVRVRGNAEATRNFINELSVGSIDIPQDLDFNRTLIHTQQSSFQLYYERAGDVQVLESSDPSGHLQSLAVHHASAGPEASFALSRIPSSIVAGDVQWYVITRPGEVLEGDSLETLQIKTVHNGNLRSVDVLSIEEFRLTRVSEESVLVHIRSAEGKDVQMRIDPRTGNVVISYPTPGTPSTPSSSGNSSPSSQGGSTLNSAPLRQSYSYIRHLLEVADNDYGPQNGLLLSDLLNQIAEHEPEVLTWTDQKIQELPKKLAAMAMLRYSILIPATVIATRLTIASAQLHLDTAADSAANNMAAGAGNTRSQTAQPAATGEAAAVRIPAAP